MVSPPKRAASWAGLLVSPEAAQGDLGWHQVPKEVHVLHPGTPHGMQRVPYGVTVNSHMGSSQSRPVASGRFSCGFPFSKSNMEPSQDIDPKYAGPKCAKGKWKVSFWPFQKPSLQTCAAEEEKSHPEEGGTKIESAMFVAEKGTRSLHPG